MSHATGPDVNDDMLPEYDFSHGIRGKHHQAYKAGTNVVFLDTDVAEAFADSAAVNDALRLLVKLAKERVPTGRPNDKRMQRTSGTAQTRRAARR
jgi:hypothetical protein